MEKERSKRGVSPLYGSSMRVVSFRLPLYIVEYLAKKKGRSGFIRELIDQIIKKESI